MSYHPESNIPGENSFHTNSQHFNSQHSLTPDTISIMILLFSSTTDPGDFFIYQFISWSHS
uniref:Uncharacterized protein n=1 Tax=Octopus bimaculoides TaxID=37653 RepID=A0A0L8HQ31_OCTBM